MPLMSENWISFPPEVNYGRLEGSNTGLDSAWNTYIKINQSFSEYTEKHNQTSKNLADANLGAMSEAIANLNTRNAAYVAGVQAKSTENILRMRVLAFQSDAARWTRIPLSVIEACKAAGKAAAAAAWWNPVAAAAKVANDTAYQAMWFSQARTGSTYDMLANLTTKDVTLQNPPYSVRYNAADVKTQALMNEAKSLGSPELINHVTPQYTRSIFPSTPAGYVSPDMQRMLNNNQYMMNQMVTPHNGLRMGGLGSGKSMPYVGTTPSIAASYGRGGVPAFSTSPQYTGSRTVMPGRTALGNYGSTTARGTMPTYNPHALVKNPALGANMPRMGQMPGMNQVPGYNAAGLKPGMPGYNANALRPGMPNFDSMAKRGFTMPAFGSGGGGGIAGGPLRAGSLGGFGGGGGGGGVKTLGGRVGPAFSGINAMDKTLAGSGARSLVGAPATGSTSPATVGSQAAGARGAGGMGGMPMRGGQQQDKEKKTTQSYIAKEVTFESLEKEEALNKRRKDMFD